MRATQPMGEKPRDWIRLLPPTADATQGSLFSANDSPPSTMPALAWNACCARQPTSTVLFPPSSPPMRSGGASSGWRRAIDRRHRRRLGGESRRPRSRGKRSGYAKSVSSRRRRTGCCIGLIDQARPWGVRRRRAQLRIAMSRPRARRGVFARSSFGFAHLSSQVFRTPFASK